MAEIPYADVRNYPLIVDAIYKGVEGRVQSDPLSHMMYCANRGGFRAVGTKDRGYKYIILYSSLEDIDWPDSIDSFNGIVTYYGDNKRAGSELHKTTLGGNRILRQCFDALHNGQRQSIPPIFFFTKGPVGRDVMFRGLLVPGGVNLSENEDLVAIWRSKDGKRFQNYRAKFTILDASEIRRGWIDGLKEGVECDSFAPVAWKQWRDSQIPPKALVAERVVDFRNKTEQLPATEREAKILQTIYDHYMDNPYAFEKCAAEIVMLMDSNVIGYDLTRRTSDGGRDAIGQYRLGTVDNYIKVEFSLEAKCYLNGPIGVEQTSRLISRIRFRQFGVMVTTSYVGTQAYKEIKEDMHPIIIIAGGDIVKILATAGLNTVESVTEWLNALRDERDMIVGENVYAK